MASTSQIERNWFGLRELTQYAAVSERTLRAWLHRQVDPLPAVRIGTKILVSRSHFDAWLERHRLDLVSAIDVDAIVNELIGSAK